MSKRQQLRDKNIDKAVLNVVDSLLNNVEYNLNSRDSRFSDSENVVFQWRETSREMEVKSKRFRRTVNKINFSINHNFGQFNDLFQIESNIDNLYEQFMTKQLEDCEGDDLVSIGITHSELAGKPLFIPPTRKHSFKKESLFNVLYEVSQSNNSFLLAGTLSLELNVTAKARGRGKSKSRAPVTIDQAKNNSKSVILINNKNNGCGFHAIAVAVAKHELEPNSYEWACLRKDTNNAQTLSAKKLALRCGLPYDKEVSCDDYIVIQSALKEYQLVVIDGLNKTNRLFIGPNYKVKKAYIELVDYQDGVSHYNAVVNITAYMGQSYHCEHRHRSYSHKYDHACAFICELCLNFPKCSEPSVKISCKNCNIDFLGKICYERHLFGKNNICRNRQRCTMCLCFYYGKHDCDFKKCKNCGENYKLQHHYCYLKNLNVEKITKEDNHNKIIVSYDIER